MRVGLAVAVGVDVAVAEGVALGVGENFAAVWVKARLILACSVPKTWVRIAALVAVPWAALRAVALRSVVAVMLGVMDGV